jgi:hypothetical protein
MLVAGVSPSRTGLNIRVDYVTKFQVFGTFVGELTLVALANNHL